MVNNSIIEAIEAEMLSADCDVKYVAGLSRAVGIIIQHEASAYARQQSDHPGDISANECSTPNGLVSPGKIVPAPGYCFRVDHSNNQIYHEPIGWHRTATVDFGIAHNGGKLNEHHGAKVISTSDD